MLQERYTRRAAVQRLVKLGAATALGSALAVAPTWEEAAHAQSQTVFYGARLGLIRDNRGWHHYVEFDIPPACYGSGWRVEGPFWPSVWGPNSACYSNGYQRVRAGYSVPSNWRVPWLRASDFRLYPTR